METQRRNTQINFGDYFANLSPYAMAKGIKGAAFQRNFENDQNHVRAAYGSFDGSGPICCAARATIPWIATAAGESE